MKRTMGKKKRKNSERSLLRYYLVGYIIVLFIPLAICSFFYQNMIRTISEDDVLKKKSDLEHSMALVDTVMNELGYLGDSLATNAAVNRFKRVEDPFAYPRAYEINKLQAQLPELYQINPSIFDYYIFFNYSEMVINKSIAYEYEDFYDLYMHPADSNSYEQWQNLMKNTPPEYGMHPAKIYNYRKDANAYDMTKEEKKNFLVYNRPLILDGGISDKSGTIQFYIDAAYIDALMPVVSDDIGGAFLITNSNKEPIYFKISKEIVSEEQLLQITETTEPFMKFGREKCLLVHLASSDSGFHYYTLYPEKSIHVRKTSAMIAAVFSIATALFVGLVLSLYMSRKSAGSVNEILKEISKETEYYDSHLAVFSHLKSTYNKLMRENSVLSDAMERQKPFICSAFINRLIYGDDVSAAELTKIMSSLEIPWQNRRFCVLVLRFSTGYADLMNQNTSWIDSCVISLLEILEQKMSDHLYINGGDGQVVLILNEENKGEETFREQAERCVCEIKEELPANIAERMIAYGGSQTTQFSDIHKSYNQAVHMFRKEKEQFENAVVWYNDNSDVMPFYPSADMEMRLTYLVSSGDQQGLHDELGELLNVYIIKNSMSIYLQEMFLSELQMIMFRILPAVDVDKEECQNYYQLLEENHNRPLLEQIRKTIHIYESVCGAVKKKQDGVEPAKIIPSVVSYIELNYGDCNLSLNSVAAAFELSESHLSTIFKQTMGMNFSSYLEGIRIDKAKEMLGATKMKVGDISEQVGYYSVNSFCRAFKRVTGSNASEYRNGMKK